MNKKEVITKENIEEYYNSVRKIKFEDKIEPKDLQEVFELIKNRYNSEATYFKSDSLQCNPKIIRSVDDYIKLCKYYFPESTMSEIITVIERNISVKDDRGRHSNIEYCGNIRKENIRYCYYGDPIVDANIFKNQSLKNQGFNNCNVAYKEFL